MSVELVPHLAIIPIIRSSADRLVMEVLGTGFFVGNAEKLHVITAKHVIESNPLASDESYAIVFQEKTTIKVVRIGQVISCKDFDLAACEISREQLPDATALPIGRHDPALNEDVFSYEYSSTRIEKNSAGQTRVAFEPYAHKGNIVRSFTSSYPEKVPTPSFLTSFPALQGASGAPILAASSTRSSFVVVGMTVANVARHLLPAQILRIDHEGSYKEETQYFLPHGKAIARSVIVQVLERIGVSFEYAE